MDHEEINKPLFVTIGPTFTFAGLFKKNYLTGQALQIVKEVHDLEAIWEWLEKCFVDVPTPQPAAVSEIGKNR